MTREEALKIWLPVIKMGVETMPECEEALNMAIKALEQEPCDDAISRQSAIFLANDLKQDLPDDAHLADMVMAHNEGVSEYQTQLSLLPPVTPQLKTGHWIAQDIHNCHTDFKCSECGYIHSFMHIYGEPTADYTYCPNCGAKMQEVEE